MSLLSDFTKAAHNVARAIIGGDILIIRGGDPVTGTAAEHTASKDFEEGGFETSSAMEIVIDSTEFSAAYPGSIASYQGKTATCRGQTWRVGTIRKGAFFTTVTLVSTNKSGS
jgi:hypothetical protein